MVITRSFVGEGNVAPLVGGRSGPAGGGAPLPVAPAPQSPAVSGGGGSASPTVTAPSGAPGPSTLPAAEFATLGNPEYITLQDEIFVALSAQAAGGTVILGGRIQLLSGEVHRFHYEIAVTAGSFVLSLFQVAEGTLLSMALTPLNFPVGQSVGAMAGLATGTLTNPTITSVLIQGTLTGASPLGNPPGQSTAVRGEILPFISRAQVTTALGGAINITQPNVSSWRLRHVCVTFIGGAGQTSQVPAFKIVDNAGSVLFATVSQAAIASGTNSYFTFGLNVLDREDAGPGSFGFVVQRFGLPYGLVLNGGANSDVFESFIASMGAASQWLVNYEFEYAP